MNTAYAPGCALMVYRPQLASQVLDWLRAELGGVVSEHLVCCQHQPDLATPARIINTCAGCDKRYRELYAGVGTVSLWEVLAQSQSFPYRDYGGLEMAIQDACPTRSEGRVHTAVRQLLARMNIKVIEPAHSRAAALCCGDSFYGNLPVTQLKAQMRRRADQMPREDVAVYCVSCIKAMHIGGKRPRYLVDLLFGQETESGTYEPDDWHAQLREYIAAH